MILLIRTVLLGREYKKKMLLCRNQTESRRNKRIKDLWGSCPRGFFNRQVSTNYPRGLFKPQVSTNYPRGLFKPQVSTNYPRGRF